MNTFVCTFIDAGPNVHLHLTNVTDATLRSVQILTVFLKDEAIQGAPSQARIKFEPVDVVYPKENVLIRHKTWINGGAAEPVADQLVRLKPEAGKLKPYVFDISWEDSRGKMCFQRIPIGH